MISVQTTLSVLDNSDAIFVKCIHLFGGSYRRYSNLGDLILVAIKKRRRTKNLLKKDIQLAFIIRSKSNTRRDNGFYLKFGKNSVFLIKNDLNMIGTKLKGGVPIEISKHPILDTNLRKKIHSVI